MTEMSNIMREMLIKLRNLETNEDDHINDIQLHHIQETTKQFKYEQCDYTCKNEIILRKPSNTIHTVGVSQLEKSCNLYPEMSSL